MATPKVTVGDDVGLTCTLLRRNSQVSIDPSASIRVAITNSRKTKSYTGAISLSMVDPLHVLADGIVWVTIPAANTTKMIPGKAVLEVEVNDPTQPAGHQETTWNLEVEVIASTLN